VCIIHMVLHSLHYVSWKEHKAVVADLRAIYTAATAEAVEQALEALEKKWQGRFPSIAESWRSNWRNVIPLFSYPPAIRKVIYTTKPSNRSMHSCGRSQATAELFPAPRRSVRPSIW